MGIKQVLAAPRSPWQRAYVEQLIGTIRRECLDHMLVFSALVYIAASIPSRIATRNVKILTRRGSTI